LGTGDFALCESGIRRVLATFDRHGQPKVKGHRFVAMSLFFYAVNFATIAGHVATVVTLTRCSQEDHLSLTRMRGKDPLTPVDAIPWRCFHLVYAARLLTDGYGFGEDDDSIEFLGDIGGVEVEWTLGALLHQLLSTTTSPQPTEPSTTADRSLAAVLVALGGCVLLYFSHKRSPRATTAYQPRALGVMRRLVACCRLSGLSSFIRFTSVEDGGQLPAAAVDHTTAGHGLHSAESTRVATDATRKWSFYDWETPLSVGVGCGACDHSQTEQPERPLAFGDPRLPVAASTEEMILCMPSLPADYAAP
ncbi:MAG: hypothetical protein SGPRY_001712, partial [Prymnesium sp.]